MIDKFVAGVLNSPLALFFVIGIIFLTFPLNLCWIFIGYKKIREYYKLKKDK